MKVNDLTSFPSNWTQVPNDEDYNLIDVANTSSEAKEVFADFTKKLGRNVTHFLVNLFF